MSRVLMLIAIAFGNALRGIRRASTTSLLAVLTIAVVLVLVGSAALLVENMSGLLDEFGAEVAQVRHRAAEGNKPEFQEPPSDFRQPADRPGRVRG